MTVDTAALRPPSRRRFLNGALTVALLGAGMQASARDASQPAPIPPGGLKSHFPFGAVEPIRPTAAWPVTTHLGIHTDLTTLLRGKTSALQLMFTGCSASCPIQGALFAQALQVLAPGTSGMQLVSLSIDALADTPTRLSDWLRKFSAKAGWVAAVPAVADVARIVQALGAGGQAPLSNSDPHSGQIYLFNRRAELVYRTPSTPPAADIVAALRLVATRWP